MQFHTDCLSEVTSVKAGRISANFANNVLHDTESMVVHKDRVHRAVVSLPLRDILIKGYVVLQLHWVHLHWVMYLLGLLQLKEHLQRILEAEIGHG